MNRRANILTNLRRRRAGVGRFVVGAFAVAYLSAGVAPCAATASPAIMQDAGDVHELGDSHDRHEHGAPAELLHDGHEHDAPAEPMHHGHEARAGAPKAHDEGASHNREHCPHCPLESGAAPLHGERSSCFAFADLTDAAAAQAKAKATPAAIAAVHGPAAFALPPPLASTLGPPPLGAVRVPTVPLNVRHCVFLI